MKLEFVKNSHQEYTLKCSEGGEVLLERTLEAKSFLRHDMMHYCVESIAGLKKSFFGRLLDDNGDEVEIMQTEKVVAILQGMDKDENYSTEKYLGMLKWGFEIMQEKVPEYLDKGFVEKVHRKYLDLLREYNAMQTGEDSVLTCTIEI